MTYRARIRPEGGTMVEETITASISWLKVFPRIWAKLFSDTPQQQQIRLCAYLGQWSKLLSVEENQFVDFAKAKLK